MTVTDVTKSNFTNIATSNSTASNSLGKEAFLEILMVQLQNQDPLNPVNDTDFIAQMAQFSSLEQMNNIAEILQNQFALSENNMLISYSELIGQTVSYVDGNNQSQTGTVASVSYKDDGIVFKLEKGIELYADQISAISK